MVDPVGTTLGAISLAVQLLDGAVKGYIFFLAVGDFPASCEHMRTKLEVEQRRILDFADAAEILDYSEGKNIPAVLRRDYLVLGAVFNQIQAKLDSLSIHTSRYKELKSGPVEAEEDVEISELSVKEKYPTLIKWDKAAKERDHMRGTKHIARYYQIGKDIVKHPKRLRWTLTDEKAFAKTREELGGYNDYLRELLDGEYSRRLEDRTKKTYLEMVLVRNELKELKQLLVTNTVLPHYDHVDHGHPISGEHTSAKLLDVLTDAKRRSVLNDFENQDRPPEYHELINVTKLEYQRISLAKHPTSEAVVKERARTSGTLKSVDNDIEVQIPIFVEWKTYNPAEGMQEPESDSTERIKSLVSLLQESKLEAFAVPTCEGFFDLRDDPDQRNKGFPPLFGIVYRLPAPRVPAQEGSEPQMPVSLFALLQGQPKPSLSARMKLAYRLSDSVMYFNSVRWYHKTLRSDAVIFHGSPEDEKANAVHVDAESRMPDVSHPLLSGFEYSRPSSGASTFVFDDPKDELYVHPLYQGSSGTGKYARSFDIYSLGIILLEIAHWEPIQTILKKEFENPDAGPSSEDAAAARSILLDPKKPYLSNLSSMAGDRYYTAVHSCIAGLVGDEEKEDEIEVSLRLHEGFDLKVVENLKALQDL